MVVKKFEIYFFLIKLLLNLCILEEVLETVPDKLISLRLF